MNIDEYTKAATRTESVVKEIETDHNRVKLLLKIIALSSTLLDFHKKEIFYKKPINIEEYDAIANQLEDLLTDDLPENININIDTRLLHSIIGCITESGELAEALLQGIDDPTNIDSINLAEEMADINWYQAIFHDSTNIDWGKNLDTNIAKLKQRFPEKFTTENAIQRDLKAEREILEGKKS